jgi:hypothetical protein
MVQHKGGEATVTLETPDDADGESVKQRCERETVLTPMEMRGLVESGEYDRRPCRR